MVTYDQLIPPLTRMPIRMAVKRLLLRQSAKAGGGGAAPCECEHHAEAYNEFNGATLVTHNVNQTSFADGATILSQAITITKECCVNVVGTLLCDYIGPVLLFELERPLGTIVVDQEDDTTSGDIKTNHYSSWEVLPPGIYTYFLVNRSGAARNIYAAQLKIVAFECVAPCVCAYHQHAYNDMVGVSVVARAPKYDTFAADATILSQAITITETCCVLAVGTILGWAGIGWFDLERPLGTVVADQEDGVQTNELFMNHYASWEVLPPGVYTYFLVNRVINMHVFATQLKIIASFCS